MKPVSRTAFYCCGLRMRDAREDRPLCGDTYAQLFMSEDGIAYLKKFDGHWGPNSSNLVRHRLIDDIVRAEVSEDPRLRVFTIGAGFDTRPYRVDGGRWVELDAPELMAYKEERLPAADARNELVRIPIDFDTERLEDKLAPFATDERALFVIEGVLMYLDVATIRATLDTLKRLFPSHRIACDLMTLKMLQKFASEAHRIIAEEGAVMKVSEPDTADVFTRAGYTLDQRVSITEHVTRFGLNGSAPLLILKTFLRTLYKGYTVAVFSYG